MPNACGIRNMTCPPLLQAGANVIGAQVANGWYCGHIGNGGFQYWGKTPALLAQLELTYADGSTERIITDHAWKSHGGPLVATDFMLGEDYDATQELAGWDRSGFNDADWLDVPERTESARAMNGQVMEPVLQLGSIPTKSVTEPKPGKWTYDLGQNMVGVVRLKVSAPVGTKIKLRHAEMLNPDGTIYTDNLRGAPSIDTYVCKGGGVETWQPKFTFHGFRYVELTGLPTKPPHEAVTGIVIGSATPQAGEFACSDGRINQLQANIESGQRGNYLSVPTDCPQRDERLGWMGDAQVFVRTATYNADVAAFFTKWLVDVTDSQEASGSFADVSPFAGPSKGTPAWGDAGVICPWTIYQAYGDLRLLERLYPSMVKWVEYSRTQSANHIRSGNRGNDYGDWLSIGADTKLCEASGQLRSLHGLITSAWSSNNDNFILTTSIPQNTTATVHVPAKGAASVLESGKPAAAVDGVTFLRMEDGAAVFAVESGRYQFCANGNAPSGTDTVSRKPAASVKVPISSLLANDGAGCAFRAVSPLSLNGATLDASEGYVTYQPQPGNTSTDRFTYTIRNSKGGVATRTVLVTIIP